MSVSSYVFIDWAWDDYIESALVRGSFDAFFWWFVVEIHAFYSTEQTALCCGLHYGNTQVTRVSSAEGYLIPTVIELNLLLGGKRADRRDMGAC